MSPSQPVRFALSRVTLAAALLSASGAIAATLLAGCGAGGSVAVPSSSAASLRAQPATGKTAVTIDWPARTAKAGRLIPFAANSIEVRLSNTDGTKLYGDTRLVRPAGGGQANASFDRVPVGAAVLTATAFPNADGTGVAQAYAASPVNVVENQNATVALTMSSTIRKLTVTPSANALTVGQSATLIATPTDTSGNVVLTNTSTLTWTSSAPDIATVDLTGKVTAVKVGTATLTAQETESGITGTATVTVTAAPTPTPTPTTNPTPTPAPASTLYEGFDYTSGQNLAGQNGGTGWGTVWSTQGPGSASVIIPNSLSFENLATSGQAYQTTSDQPIADNRDFATPVGSPGQVVYFSLLIKPLDAMNAGSPDTYFGFYLSNLAITKGASDSHWGILDPNNNYYAASSVVVQQNVTYFLVVRITYANKNSVADLFVDPTPGQPLPAKPDATLTLTNLSQSTFYGTGTSIRCVYDELRLGSTYASVSPTK